MTDREAVHQPIGTKSSIKALTSTQRTLFLCSLFCLCIAPLWFIVNRSYHHEGPISFLGVLPVLSSAFVAPRSAYQQMSSGIVQQKQRNTVVVFDQMGISEDSLSSAALTEAEANVLAAPPLSEEAGSSAIEDDMGKAIFLANAEENAGRLGIMEDEDLVVSTIADTTTSPPSSDSFTKLNLEDGSLVTPN